MQPTCIPGKAHHLELFWFLVVQWTTVRTCFPTDVINRPFAAVHNKHLYVAVRSESEGALVYRVAEQSFKSAEKLNAPPDSYQCNGLISQNHSLYYVSQPPAEHDPDEHTILFQLDEATEPSRTDQHSQKSLTWRRLQNGQCPLKQLFPACFGVGASLVLAGGYALDKSLTLVTEYDLLSEDWCTPSTWPSLPKAAQQQQPVVLGNDIHLIGGVIRFGSEIRRTTSTHSIRIERNGRLSGEWREADLPSPPSGGSGACRLFQTVIVAGGRREDQVHPGVHVLDPDTRKWLPLPPLKTSRTQPSVVFFQGCLFVIGGGDGSIWLSTVERLALSWAGPSWNKLELKLMNTFLPCQVAMLKTSFHSPEAYRSFSSCTSTFTSDGILNS